ncbi:MAG: cytidine deaminase [Turicibacter sp.]|nr:cytidine deaminase [Turicibacter sp.]
MSDKDLVEKAVEIRESAYAPYSGFLVGAALLNQEGKVYTGVNVENASYTPSICAERTAFSTAVACGERKFSKIAIAGWQKDGTIQQAFPCGVCRQVMREFCDPETFTILVAGADGFTQHSLAELLPNSFGPENLA